MRLLGLLKNALYSVSIYSFPADSAVNFCGDPGTPTNGQRSHFRTTPGYVVTYTCDVGYTLQGSNSRTCQSNGQWSGSVPQCIGMLVYMWVTGHILIEELAIHLLQVWYMFNLYHSNLECIRFVTRA